jgi:DNA polymerase elongation subunit (family B)
MNILESDFPIAEKVLTEQNLLKLIIRSETSLPSQLDEKTLRLYTKFPRQIRQIREALDGLLTFNADIKWEKMCIQLLKWKQFIEVENFSPYSMTPLDNIKPSTKTFPVHYNIMYWDIETGGIGTWKDAPRIPIISYSVISKKTKTVTFYAWRKDWTTTVKEGIHNSVIQKRVKKLKNYPLTFNKITKHFSNEIEMHQCFLKDFTNERPHGIMTFNGRGGNRIVRGRRQWFDGFDMPLFYERCVYLGLKKDLYQMSPLPQNDWNVHVSSQFKYGVEVKHEIQIKCVPQHDLYFDGEQLMYSKDEYDMKRHNLDTYMLYFLGVGKIEHKHLKVHELLEQDPEKEELYNIVDTEGMYALDIHFSYTDDVIGRATAYGGKVEDAVYTSKLHDHINLWFTSDQYVMDTKPEYDEEEGFIHQRKNLWKGLIPMKMGGFNLPPKTGLFGYHEKKLIAILDFSKLYPNCDKTANSDPRSKVDLMSLHLNTKGLFLQDSKGRNFEWSTCARSDSCFFRKDVISLNNLIYDDLNSKRNKIKKIASDYLNKFNKTKNPIDFELYNQFYTSQFSFKGIINGKFGSNGTESTRNYDIAIYNTPPSMGQSIIKYVIFELLPEFGYEVIFSSTDSAMVILNETDTHKGWDESQILVEKLNKRIEEFVIYEYNPIKNCIKLDCEKIFDVAIIFNMRQYMLNVVVEDSDSGPIFYDNPRIYFRGMDLVRRSTANITVDVQRKVLDMVRKRLPVEDICNYVLEIDKTFETLPWGQICGHGGISNNPDDVSEENRTYKAISNANKLFERSYGAGDNPLMGDFIKHPYFIKGITFPARDIIPLSFEEEDEYPLKKMGFDLDYKKLKEKYFISKVRPILTLLGIEYETLQTRLLGDINAP